MEISSHLKAMHKSRGNSQRFPMPYGFNKAYGGTRVKIGYWTKMRDFLQELVIKARRRLSASSWSNIAVESLGTYAKIKMKDYYPEAYVPNTYRGSRAIDWAKDLKGNLVNDLFARLTLMMLYLRYD
ncbi:hypothetical protein Syun_025618 [Stephania yunnanensis]|uniref:Uncharacterized protein n=1 Tax=Stephania yunnanensis TaxID=152371 RepID=A0AAP0EZ53_9MAGN